MSRSFGYCRRSTGPLWQRWPSATGLVNPRYIPDARSFGDMGTDDVKQLEQENTRFKKIVAEKYLEIEVMREIAAKKW